eukprot:c9649_g1_i7.p1 GENE.c9649_g1_i7~~c9649_g1_i7.p1  ORF type:complete len:324 (-),score=47.21 c9649_g1_i7:919-1890(-)
MCDSFGQGTCSVGQLTSLGFQQHLYLGQQIAQVYSNLISISPNLVYARSTNVIRARQSCEALLAGVFENTPFLQPIPIFAAVDSDFDILEPMSSRCPNLAKLMNDMRSSAPWIEHIANRTKLLNQLAEICQTGDLPDWNSDFDHYSDNFHTRVCHGKDLPCNKGNCVTQDMVDQVFAAAEWEWDYRYFAFERFKKVSMDMGPLLSVIWDRVKNPNGFQLPRTNNTPNVFVYAGHDDTIAPLASALNISSTVGWPPYASNIIFELWSPTDKSKQKFLRVLYNGAVQQIGSCQSTECTLADFERYFDQNIDFNYSELCGLQKPGS